MEFLVVEALYSSGELWLYTILKGLNLGSLCMGRVPMALYYFKRIKSR
jgi:hypothetical protein